MEVVDGDTDAVLVTDGVTVAEDVCASAVEISKRNWRRCKERADRPPPSLRNVVEGDLIRI